MQRPEVADRAVLGEVASPQHPERQILVQLAFDLAQAEHAGGVTENHHLEHHCRVEGLVVCTGTSVAGVERAQVQCIDGVADEVGQVPFGQDVAVVGFDDVPIAEVFEPALTTVAQPMLALGAAAVDLLLAHMVGQSPGHRVLPHRLVLRESAWETESFRSCPLSL